MKKTFAIIILLFITSVLSVTAQRRITPVDVPTTSGSSTKKTEMDRTNVVERQDASGNIILVDTVAGSEWTDTLAVPAKIPKMQYPLIHAISAGINIWDPAMRIFGQQYGGADVWVELSLHNRYKPILEFGLSAANITPDEMNYTFYSPLSPYFKIGANYNIFYNSNPDYQLNVGLRYGLTHYSWQVKDVTVDEGYWNEPSHFSIPSQKSTAGFFEITAGVKVKIVKWFSLGWNIKFRTILHETKSNYGEPMYVPGIGKRSSSLGISLNAIYTIELNGRKDTTAKKNQQTANDVLTEE